MSGKQPRRGRRDNGLDASAYVPLADVDPRVGEHLLDVLKLAGVPAYLEPSADVEPYTRNLALPSPPTDRLWVDSSQRVAARQIVAAEVDTPGPDQPDRQPTDEDKPSSGLTDIDEERAWRDIVQGFGQNAAHPVPPWPVAEDASPDRRDRTDADEEPPGVRTAGSDSGSGSDADEPETTADEPVTEPDEGHYVPPPPPPVPRLSRQALTALLMIAGGAVLLVAPDAFGFTQGTGFGLGVLAIVGGAALLVWRLGERHPDDGPDDGAVV